MPFWATFAQQSQLSLSAQLSQARQTRSLWRLLKLFPHALGGGLSDEDLTETQWTWLQCQLLLDEGVQACPECDALNRGAYCTACGTRLAPEARPCDTCQAPGTGTYCGECGALLRSVIEEAVDAGTFDWEAWAKSLAPFLGGLTAQEQQVLTREGFHGNGIPDTEHGV